MAGSDTAPTLVSLHVIVRNLIAPGRAVEAADVRVRNASAAATAPVWAGPYLTTDAAGHVRRDSLRLATYDVAVRALGFSAFVTRVRISPGCDAWMELYLVPQFCDIGDCPPAPKPRATVTRCAPERKRAW